jgi:hypothetical protein
MTAGEQSLFARRPQTVTDGVGVRRLGRIFPNRDPSGRLAGCDGAGTWDEVKWLKGRPETLASCIRKAGR